MPMFDPALDHRPTVQWRGLAFLVKDSGPFAKGVPFALGCHSIRGAVADEDRELMSRFRSAGLLALGQTTAPVSG